MKMVHKEYIAKIEQAKAMINDNISNLTDLQTAEIDDQLNEYVNNLKTAKKENAVRQAIANSGLSGFVPTKFGMFMYAKWISNECTANEAIALIIKYHKSLENTEPLSDGLASPNKLGITDKNRLKSAEADITTLRMAELY